MAHVTWAMLFGVKNGPYTQIFRLVGAGIGYFGDSGVGDQNGSNRHQHLIFVTNTFRLRHRCNRNFSPKSSQN